MRHPEVGIDRDLFLRVLNAHSLFLAETLLGPEAADGYLRKLGESVGRWVEEQYRADEGIEGPLTREQYADLIVDFKRRTGACLVADVQAGTGGNITATNTHCPFAPVAVGTSALCRLDADIFGSIAARNFGYAQVVGYSTLVTGGERCCFELRTSPQPVGEALLVAEYSPKEAELPEQMRERLGSAEAIDTLRREVGASQAALAQANRSLEALLEMSAALCSSLDEPTLLRHAARYAAQLSGGPAGFAARAEGQALLVEEWWDGSASLPAALRPKVAPGVAFRCARERRPVVSNLDHEPLAPSSAVESGRVWLCAPVLDPRGALLAVVGAQAPSADAPDCLPLLECLCRQTAVALVNARLHATDVRETETARELLAELQHKSEALAAAQERLTDAEKLAALGLFSQAIAHDLRNPLATVQTALFSLGARLPASDTRAARACAMATEQVRRAGTIIQDMLALTQQQPPRPAPVRVAAAAEAAVEALSVPEGVSVEVAAGAEVPAVLADPGHLRQILQNLCENAVQAIEGEGSVRVEAAVAGDAVCVRVLDTAPGIAPEDLGHIFRPFWSKKKRGAHGYGIGLALCRALAERNGGSLTVESEVGKGSAFTLTLPRAPEAG